jgi:hypothetical protein
MPLIGEKMDDNESVYKVMFWQKKLKLLVLLIGVILIVMFVYGSLLPPSASLAQEELILQPPAVMDNQDSQAVMSNIEDEAGISGYFMSPMPIDLNDVRDLYNTIEAETADYIIGEMLVSGYGEIEATHVFINTDGWVLAYYRENYPVSKIAHIVGSLNVSSTKLETVLQSVASAVGTALPTVSYYDFRHPNATNILFVGESSGGGSATFDIEIPGSYVYYERSWALRSTGSFGGGDFLLDGANISGTCTYCYGTITPAQLLPNVNHTIAMVDNPTWGVLVLLYSVP